MSENSQGSLDRRAFLHTTAAAGLSAAALGQGGAAPAQEAAPVVELPQRVLGRTGAEVTILNHGTYQAPGALDRLLRFSYSNGVRYFDTARTYGSEPAFKRWFAAAPDVRKSIFLVTKDNPRGGPRDLLSRINERLEALGTDYLDLLFIHGLGDHDFDTELGWLSSNEFKQTAETLRKSGKTRFVGFSSHHARRAELLEAAAKSGFLDVIMVQYTPWLDLDSPLNKALDACHKAGIGLVSMKQVAGQFQNPAPELAAVFAERKITPFQGLLHAIWTDERISTSCVSMRNLEHIKENTEAAQRYEPFKKVDIERIRDAALAAGPTLCADCDGRCSRAAGTDARLGDLTRYLTYHEHHGIRGEARRLYAELSQAERSWQGADLDAARAACPSGLDFAQLLPKVDRTLT